MSQRSLLLMAVLVGCGTEPDPRPPTFDVIATEILAPTCGQVQCHSTTTRTEHYAFDTYAAAHDSLQTMLSGTFTPTNNELWEVLHEEGEERMPPDSPLADQDMALIQTWLEGGAVGVR